EPWSWSNDNYAEIQFGDAYNTIRGTFNSGIGFYTPNNYIFHTGNVGIGKTPTEKLDVNGNIKANGFILPVTAGEGRLLHSDAEVNASWADPAWRVSGNNVFREQGNTGIGTCQPLTALHIAQGDIYLQDIESGIIMKSPDGRCWRGVINNSGELEFSEADCPEDAPQSAKSDVPARGCRIYPNPAKGKIIVEAWQAGEKGLLVEITDMRGAVCYAAEIKGSRHTVSTDALPAGFYTVKVATPAGEPLGVEKIAVHK
ncbi:MAG: T9SS type A sorting domain-containing protein, partial [Bacteroidales bacterium]|nr:T9SS type A sorting domain-containing protein [Bacteroidales bacterium]